MILLFALIMLASCSTKNFNDLDEAGLNGSVKSVTKTSYQNLEKVDGKYIIGDNTPVKKNTHFYNEDGELKNIEFWYNPGSGLEKKTELTFTHKDGKISKLVSKELDIGESKKSHYNWINDYEYEFGDTTKDGTIFYTKIILSPENGREIENEFKLLVDGKLNTHERQKHTLDEKRVISTTTTDVLSGKISEYTITYLKEDKHGNATEYYIYDKTNDALVEYVVREVSYY